MPSPEVENCHFDLEEPPPELQEYARLHCGEDPNTRLQAICEFREMIFERGECTPHRVDDEFLIRFLRARNFIPQRAHRLLVNYYQFKEEYPELFDFYPMDLRPIGDANIVSVPPYRDQDGRRLLLLRIGCWDPKAIPIDDFFKGIVFALELGLLEQRTQILGGVAIFDLEDIGTHHAWQITPSVASRIVKLLVSSFPATTYAIHIINHAWIFDKIYTMFRPFLNAQMRSRIYFHSHDFSSLHKHIRPENLPKRYGGVHPDYPYTLWVDTLKKEYTVAKEVLSLGYKFREDELCPKVVTKLKEEGIELP